MDIIFVELDGRKWRVEIVNGISITNIEIVAEALEKHLGGKVGYAEVRN